MNPERAEMFARGAHLGQKHGDRPYYAHLKDVVAVLKRWTEQQQSPTYCTLHLICAAWLHDTIEDTPATYQDILQLFGEQVAELVWAVTDEMGRNRKERKEKTWPKISATRDATILKLADLTANVEDCFATGSKLQQMYQKEWRETKQAFAQALVEHGEIHLQDELDNLGAIINGDIEAPKR